MDVFSGLVGQEGAKGILSAGLASGSLPQALVFAGPDGVGRRTTVKMLALALHGEDQNAYLADTFWFAERLADKFARKVTGAIKGTADDLVHFIQLSPLISKHKVAIVEDAEELSEEAQNALLKTLEEPRADSVIVLIVKDENSLLPTILSRAQVIKFVSLSDDQVCEVVGQKATDEITALANGSAGVALQLLENLELLEETRNINQFWQTVGGLDLETRFGWSEKMRERETATQFLQTGLRVARVELLDLPTKAGIARIEEIDKTLTKVGDNANVRLALDSMMLIL